MAIQSRNAKQQANTAQAVCLLIHQRQRSEWMIPSGERSDLSDLWHGHFARAFLTTHRGETPLPR